MKKKLNKRELRELWGETGPYSQANLIKEVRILDDSVSRTFLTVEVDINPTTFEIVFANRDHPDFTDDRAVQQLLDSAEDRRPFNGYVSMAFTGEYVEPMIIAAAELALSRAQATVIKMHRFVMENYS